VLDFMFSPEREKGRLVAVLEPHAARGPELAALTQRRKASTPRVRVVLDVLVDTRGRGGRA
jgi:DNA-binding transcriptional LysR family regulator